MKLSKFINKHYKCNLPVSLFKDAASHTLESFHSYFENQKELKVNQTTVDILNIIAKDGDIEIKKEWTRHLKDDALVVMFITYIASKLMDSDSPNHGIKKCIYKYSGMVICNEGLDETKYIIELNKCTMEKKEEIYSYRIKNSSIQKTENNDFSFIKDSVALMLALENTAFLTWGPKSQNYIIIEYNTGYYFRVYTSGCLLKEEEYTFKTIMEKRGFIKNEDARFF